MYKFVLQTGMREKIDSLDAKLKKIWYIPVQLQAPKVQLRQWSTKYRVIDVSFLSEFGNFQLNFALVEYETNESLVEP